MSEKALLYSKEPLSHRFLVIYEAAGISGDFAEYLVRTLLSEGHLRVRDGREDAARVAQRAPSSGKVRPD